MCFIFTYISWTFDLIQRVWSFLMSCCIGGAVCLLFFMAVASGVAFGYHYSISEFLTYNDSKLTISLTRDIDSPIDTDIWWPNDPQDIYRRSGVEQFYKSTTEEEEEFDIDTTTEVVTATQSDYTTIIYETVINAVTTVADMGLENVAKNYPDGSVNQMKAVLNHIHWNKGQQPTRTTTKPRTTYTYSRKSKRKTVKPFEYIISDYDDILMTARTFTPIALFSEYDETEIENWRRVAQSMQYDYPIEVHENLPRLRDEAYPIYDGAVRKELTVPRKGLKSAFYLIQPSYPVPRAETPRNTMDKTTITTTTTKTIKPIKLMRYTKRRRVSNTGIKFKISKYNTKVIKREDNVSEKDVNGNKTTLQQSSR